MEKLDLPYLRAENTSALFGTWFLSVGSGEEGRVGALRSVGFILSIEHLQKNGVPGAMPPPTARENR